MVARGRRAAIDDDALRAARELEGECAGMRLARIGDRRRPAGIDQEQRVAALDALVAGIDGARRPARRASRRRRAPSRRGSPADAATPLKCAKAPSPCRKKRSIGIIRSMEFINVSDGTRPRAMSACLSGRRSTRISTSAAGLREMWPPSGRICACSSASMRSRPVRRQTVLLRQRQPDQRDGDSRMHAQQARLARIDGGAKHARVAEQRADEVAIEVMVGVVQDERRLRQERRARGAT